MKIVRWWAALAFVAMLVMLSGRAGAQDSDGITEFAGDTNQLGQPGSEVGNLVYNEVAAGTEKGTDKLGLKNFHPVTIDLLEPRKRGTVVSDRLTITSFDADFTFNDPGTTPEEPGLSGDLLPGMSFIIPLQVVVNSDDEIQGAKGSDTVSFFTWNSATMKPNTLIGAAQLGITSNPLAIDEPSSAGVGESVVRFALTDPIVIPLFEKNGQISDRITISQFSGTFESDPKGNSLGSPKDGEHPFDETEGHDQPMFTITAFSDTPEAPGLMLLSVGLLPVGWALVRRRRSLR